MAKKFPNCPDGPHYEPGGYPCCNPTFDAAVKAALKKDAKKIQQGHEYLRNCVLQLRKATGR